ncbi:23S rRNA (guanine(1835)-N(2))-methyltransferase RlmG [Biostraticola tofi]|uniref:Ribosomal RNA large subunit methyltransferase G n=1 Tax=Biostraticola tofi TaxID=466109 RepID=A0A4V2W587_9GAMM|nr:23S rRNA (guanine(1835)-N(2))-methyltransferase RlmG [Biostraticola tofi]TCV98814.1 23S rRNA (guanine1835-N2)-methyltransferase [Biostraticola tofi]
MSVFDSALGVFELERFPPDAASDNLQAWDAADEYLLLHCSQLPLPEGPTLLFNDNFGALTVALCSRSPITIGDSWLGHQAARYNLAKNDLPAENATFLDSLAPLPPAPALVLIKVPKTLALLEHQLHAVRAVATPETIIIAAGKARDIHTSTLQRFSDILGPTTTSLARKKARLIFSKATAQVQPAPAPTLSWPLEGTPYHVHNHASVFSRASLDIGARFFLQHLPEGIAGTLVDLGCGNGVIGLMLLAKNPDGQIHFADESYMAIASSRLNIAVNRPEDVDRCAFSTGHSLAGFEPDSLQAVLCNPPFHQQQTLTDNIAREMFRDAKRCLAPGGELRIVANRHLDYYQQIKRLFGNCTTLGANPKFVVLRAVKTRAGQGGR